MSCQCKLCFKTFSRKDSLTRHIKTVHKILRIMEPLTSNQFKPNMRYYADCTRRLATYRDWAKYHYPRPVTLAQAGFIYKGAGDIVQCFYCSTCIKDWKNSDCAWSRHKIASPHCEYLKICYTE